MSDSCATEPLLQHCWGLQITVISILALRAAWGVAGVQHTHALLPGLSDASAIVVLAFLKALVRRTTKKSIAGVLMLAVYSVGIAETQYNVFGA